MKRKSPISPDPWFYERGFWDRGLSRVAGIDEVGRGPLAGPVVAVAAILDEAFDDPGVADSKTLTPARRLELYPLISWAAIAWGVGVVEPDDIDRHNILNATFLAMRNALDQLPIPADAILVDGKYNIPDVGLPQRAVVGGDRESLSIGSASILAKEIRDRIMEEYDSTWPGYGFARHKGYATAEHTAALSRLGPTPIHRKSFAPLRLWRQNRLEL